MQRDRKYLTDILEAAAAGDAEETWVKIQSFRCIKYY